MCAKQKTPKRFNARGNNENVCDETLNIGIKVGGTRVNNIRYANDTVMIAENKNDLQKISSVENEVSNTFEQKINIAKTKTMVMSKSNKKHYRKSVNVSINKNGVEKVWYSYISEHVLLIMKEGGNT